METQHLTASDLMIGDWIRISSDDSIKEDIRGRAVQVLGLREEDAEIRVDLGNDPEYRDYWSNDEDDFEPIPLTPEILMKNGVTLDEVGDDGVLTGKGFRNRYEKWRLHTKWKDVYILFDRVAKLWRMTGIYVGFRYVHELQHRLQVCNIDKEITL